MNNEIVDSVKELIKFTFDMAEECGSFKIRDTFDLFCAVWKDNTENLKKLSEFLDERENYMYELMTPTTKGMGLVYGELGVRLRDCLNK